MHHFFVDPRDIDSEYVTITGANVNHIKNVLRVKRGEKVLISNGHGKDMICEIETISGEEIKARIEGGKPVGTELPSEIYLFQGLPKADKMELIIQKAVELGVKEIIPVSMTRSVVKLDEKRSAKKIERWQAISEAAANQSKRGIIPNINSVMNFETAIAFAAHMDLNVIPYELFRDMSATKKIMEQVKPGMKIGIFIGPEGGFDDAEIDMAIENNIHQISLGKRILRTETAGLAILSVMMFKLEEESVEE